MQGIVIAIILFLLIFKSKFVITAPSSSSYSSPKMQGCGDDLKHLINYLCTYKNEKLPCFQHFLTNDKENPLEIINAMKQRELQENFQDENNQSSSNIPLLTNHTLIEQCCYGGGCSIVETRNKYCCFTKQCLDLCYPGDFDVFRL